MASIGLAIARVVSKSAIKRNVEEYQEIYAIADPIEIRVARAYERSVQKLIEGISINELGTLLATGNIDKAMRLFTDEKIENSLKPLSFIIEDTLLRGGRIGAKILRQK